MPTENFSSYTFLVARILIVKKKKKEYIFTTQLSIFFESIPLIVLNTKQQTI